MSIPPPPPPPGGFPPSSAGPAITSTPPPPGAYPGTGFQGFPSSSTDVYTYGSTPPGRWPRASWLRRLIAHLIDGLLLSVFWFLAVVALAAGPTEISTCDITADGSIAVFGEEGVTTGLCEGPTGGAWALFGLLLLAAVAVFFILSAAEGRTGATPGKRVMGLRTIDHRTGEVLGAGRGIARNLVRGALMFVPLIGALLDHLWPLWDEHGQTLHDKAIGAQVIDAGNR